MSVEDRRQMPLIGALLVAEGRVELTQMIAALEVAPQRYPGLSIGEVLVREGLLSNADLEIARDELLHIRERISDAINAAALPPISLRARLIAAEQPEGLIYWLRRQGVFCDWSQSISNQQLEPADLLLIDPSYAAFVADQTVLLSTPAVLLPAGLIELEVGNEPAAWASALLKNALTARRKALSDASHINTLRRSEFELISIAALTRAISAAANPTAALSQIMIIIRDLIAVEAATLFRLAEKEGELIFEVVLGPNSDGLDQSRLPIDRGIAGWVARHNEPLLINDVRADHRFWQALDRQTGFQTRSVICVPVPALGRSRGVLQLINKIGGEFSEHDLTVVQITAALGGLMQLVEDLGYGVWR